MTAFNCTGLVNPATDLLDSTYVQPNPDNSWRMASAYRLDKVQTMTENYPASNAGIYAAHKWADTFADYKERMVWRGGEGPHRITALQQPEWAQLGNTTGIQIFNRVATSDPLIFEHQIPEFYAVVRGRPDLSDVGETFRFRYMIESQDGQILFIQWDCTVDNSGRIKYLDAVAGLDTNAGTFAAPFQTFPKMWNLTNANQFVFRLKDGVYNVSNGSGGNASFASNRPLSIRGCGTSSSTVILDLSTATFAGAGSDICVTDLTVTNAPVRPNPRQFDFGSRVENVHFSNIKWDTRIGTDNGDNPCGAFFPDVNPPSLRISIVDCELLPTSTASMVIYFGTDNVVEENCFSSGVIFPTTNGSLVSHTKGRNTNTTYRYVNYSADSNNGIIWVSNQNPEACANIEMQYFRLVNVGTGNSEPIRFNGQVISGTRPSGMLIQRGSINGGNRAPLLFEAYVSGADVEYGGILWSSSTATSIDSTGGVSLANPSVKVADIDTNQLANAGIGFNIYSTLVV
jgi:hypothetical protein